MSRAWIAALVTGFSILSFCPDPALGDPSDDTFTFAVIGDRTGGHQEGVFAEVMSEVAFFYPDLMVTVGDHIEGYLPDSADIEAEWTEFMDLIERPGIPYYLTPGNHDIWDDQSRRIYRGRFGRADSSFVYGNSLFVILDVSTLYKEEEIPAGTIDWLEGELGRGPDYDNLFVFYHKPFWCEDFAFDRTSSLHELFVEHGVDVVFTGHYHRHFRDERDGVRYLSVGSSGGGLPAGGRPKGSFYAYLLVKVEGDTVEVRFMEPGGKVAGDILTLGEAIGVARIERESVHIEEIETSSFAMKRSVEISVTVENLTESTIRDTAGWSLRGAWSVEPSEYYLEVPPGEVGSLTAMATVSGPLFLAPRFRLGVPYGDESIRISQPMILRRTASAPRVSERPAVDGVLDDGVWTRTQLESRYYGYAGGSAGTDSTALWMACDARNLYLAVKCFDSRPESIYASVEDRDGFVSYDDYFSFLIQPDRRIPVFYQITVNPLGRLFDRRVEICPLGTYVAHRDWNPPLEVSARIGEDGWVAELVLPLAEIGVPEGALSLGFNFRRSQKRLAKVADFQSPFWFSSDALGLLTLGSELKPSR
jgi:hypothetical protein